MAGGVSGLAQRTEPVFEVVSIKPVQSLRLPRPVATRLQLRPDGVRASGVTAQGLISVAFPTDGVPRLSDRIAGGPDWLDTAQFELVATLPDGAPANAVTVHLASLLRSVLEERFRLRGHLELRPVPIYALVASRRNGTLGPLLRQSDPRSETWNTSGEGYISAIKMTMGALASRLTSMNAAGRVVMDRSALQGPFDVDLYWSQPRTAATGPVPPEVDGPSLFTAVREQLGLKLEPRTERQDVYVIDYIERPAPN
jgi:uncharacterized protein (TIGR03435 family)